MSDKIRPNATLELGALTICAMGMKMFITIIKQKNIINILDFIS
jgi:hypothetical protein